MEVIIVFGIIAILCGMLGRGGAVGTDDQSQAEQSAWYYYTGEDEE